MAGYWLAGLWTQPVTHYYFVSLLAIFPAIVLGRIINHRLSEGTFLRYVYAGLAVIGVLLILQSGRA
jgi:uncharacterized protein